MEVTVNGLRKNYGDNTVVDIPSLTVRSGESFGLVGNNGAGKTTLFRCLLDLIRPTSGYASVDGKDVAKDDSWKHYTGSYLDENFLIGHLTPEEYFDFVASLHGVGQSDLSVRLEAFTAIFNGEILGGKKLIRDLSKGNQKKVGIAAALIPNPKVLVLDEPFANLDPSTQIRLKELLKSLRNDRGVTMLISSHDLNHVIEVSERIVLLEKGIIKEDIRTEADTLQKLERYFAGTEATESDTSAEQ